ncbi:U3 small nucleolar RNA-associated protein-like protein [Periconia macrospinosa]|uniref:U3 small nucleolar RNA-associated protein-like protein n=1 Tax=Periconia macrospinosa TaxID=97972 RepID=A0A2V1DUD3_9PLEO|nr:U3 small nucleolar RNA-associated protein-like protein [Periconia macrospinosa]
MIAAAKKASKRERFLPPKAKDTPLFPPEFDLKEDEAQAGALQPVNAPAADWEGFGTEEEDNEDDEEDEDEDEKVMKIAVEKKQKEKPVLPKDAEEEELERIVFGDSAGFKEGIEGFSLDYTPGKFDQESSDEQDDADDYENAEDQDLFFFDAGPTAAPAGSTAVAKAEETEDEDDKPAWEDSDDERLVVSLATVPQLRKLRETAEDDIVNGREYVRRLRKQYERLYSTPDWALQASGKSKRKRQHTIEDGESDADSVSDMDVDDDDLSTLPLAKLLQNADILSKASRGPTKRRKLQSGTVDIQRLKDVSKAGPSAITSLSFHPSYPLLLSSGPSSTLSLHHVDPNPPTPNPLLTSLHIKRTPLTTTAFHPSPSDSRIFISARRKYFHVWNIATGTVEKISRVYGHQHEQKTMEYFSLSPNGKYMALRGSSKKGGGVINVLDASTLQWTTQVRIESRGGVADFVWWGDGNGLCVVAKNGEVTEWSVQDGVIGRWIDDGAVGTTVIAVGGKSGRDGWLGGDRWVAVGSSSGIVNVYDRRAWTNNSSQTKDDTDNANNGIPKAPKPYRVLDHLTTPISHLAFTADGQILAMASRWKNNALRLVHLPSATVFRNWPTEKTPLGRITALAWGRPVEEEEREGSLALLAIGTEAGRIKLWDVRA